MIPWYASSYKKTTKRGDFGYRLVGSWDPQKAGNFAKRVGV